MGDGRLEEYILRDRLYDIMISNITYLLYFTEFIYVPLITLHAVLCQLQMRGVFAQFLLILWHLFDHLRQVAHALLVTLWHPF